MGAVGLHVALHTSRFDVSAVGAVGLHVALQTSRFDCVWTAVVGAYHPCARRNAHFVFILMHTS